MSEAVTLNHNLSPYFKDLSQAKDSKDLKKHPVYQRVYPEIEAVLRGYETGSFASPATVKPYYRAVTWNIERGIEFEGILHTFRTHPILKEADLYFIPETDMGMVRSGNRNVARELAEALQLHYYFVPTY